MSNPSPTPPQNPVPTQYNGTDQTTPAEAELDRLMADYECLCTFAALIAEMPIEKWLRDIEHAETVGAILDTTLYRNYVYSHKPVILKDIMRAAMGLKRAVLDARKVIEAKGAKANA